MNQEIKENYSLYLGDNIQWLKTLPSDSVDSVLTDPPYGLTSIVKRFGKANSKDAQFGSDGVFKRSSKGFMGKEWDADVPSVDFWREVYRILKPGGHILSFGGTRTYHRMVTNIENAGFEIIDQLQWIYATGFPKSHNIGKAIDKQQGNKRKDLGFDITTPNEREKGLVNTKVPLWMDKPIENNVYGKDKRTILQRKQKSIGNSVGEGWGTGLKPANEPICLARKPSSERTIALNVIKHGTGGINIDGCRIEYTSSKDEKHQQNIRKGIGEFFSGAVKSICVDPISTGRFPSNVLIDESIGRILDEQSGVKNQEQTNIGPSKFFYIPKPTKKEKSIGLNQISNTHPTVKPISLFSYLVRLITPPGGTVLDPYMGSGSGGISTLLEGFKFIGMDKDPEYFEIAKERIKNYESYREILVKQQKPKKLQYVPNEEDSNKKPVISFWLKQAI